MKNNVRRLKLFREEDIQRIYNSALDILQRTGVRVREQTVVKALESAGCNVVGDQVRMPASLVEEQLRKAPRRFNIYNRAGVEVIRIEEQNLYFQPMIGRLNILDLESGKKRRTNLDDVSRLIRIADALPNYKMLHSGAIMPHIEGIPDKISHVYGYIASTINSSKVIKGTCRGRNKAIDCIQMASVICGGEEELRNRPNLFTTYNVISPLEHGREMLEGLTEYVKHGVPVDITSEPQMGATSPITIAGTVAQQSAEVFSGVVIAQILSPGTPVFIGTCGAAMDMRYGVISLGSIEAGLINCAHAQIAKYCNIPSRGTGSNTQAKVLDFQAGYEKTLTLMLAALAGINMLFYPGTIEHAETVSMESLVLDHEICSVANQCLGDIDVSDETLAVDIINKVGSGNSFLGEKHTLKHLQGECYMPRVSDYRKRSDWEKAGAEDIAQVAKTEVRRILAEHKPLAMEASIAEQLLRIAREIEKRETKKNSKMLEALFYDNK